MSNIISLATRTADFSTPEDKEIYFPVSMQEFEVPYPWGCEPRLANADNFRAVVREDTGKVLAVHSDDYKLVENRHLFDQFEEAIRKSQIDVTDAYTKVEVNDDGGSVVKSYHFPAHQIEISEGDMVDMQIRVRNSYDGRWAFGTILGGYRLICSNGMTIGQKFMSSYGRHTKNLDISTSVDKLDASVKIYLDHHEIWKHWAKKTVSDMQVRQLLEDDLKLPEKFSRLIYDLYLVEKSNGIRGIWALFNALTYWSTHYKRKSGAQQSVTQDNREKKVREIITSSAFNRLAA